VSIVLVAINIAHRDREWLGQQQKACAAEHAMFDVKPITHYIGRKLMLNCFGI